MLGERLFDFAFALLALIFFAPFLLVISLLIKLDSKGPILFRQQRIGKNNRPFWLYKLRTMNHGSEKGNPNAWSVDDDHRITRFGRILRKTWLDEIPQLYNVLKGEMNIVGPRPELPYYVHMFSRYIPDYDMRHRFEPGLTGLSQVLGLSGDTCIIERFNKDLEYIKRRSPRLDRRIMLQTIRKAPFGIRRSELRCSTCPHNNTIRSRWGCLLEYARGAAMDHSENSLPVEADLGMDSSLNPCVSARPSFPDGPEMSIPIAPAKRSSRNTDK